MDQWPEGNLTAYIKYWKEKKHINPKLVACINTLQK